MKYLFELGHQPHISTAEVLAVLKLAKIKSKFVENKNDFFILEIEEHEEKIEKLAKKFGSIIQVGSELENKQPAKETIIKYLLEKELSGKINFSISPTNNKLAINIKKEVRNTGKSVRYVEVKNTATILHNKLVETKTHFTVLGNTVYKTIFIQDIEGFSKRDYDRPASDNVSGMLPPKLARTMINLAEVDNDKVLLDAFCGSGTVLNEALSLGFNHIVGSDISEKAIEDSQKNVEWFIEENELKNVKTNIFLSPSTELSSKLKPQSIDVIVSEPYMGKPLRGNDSKRFLDKQVEELKALYIASFKTFHKILKTEGTVIFIIPKFKFENDWIVIRCLDEIKSLGFEITNFANEDRSLLYHRDKQYVGRELWKIRKIN